METQSRFVKFLLDRIDAKLADGDVEEVRLYVTELRTILDSSPEPSTPRPSRQRKRQSQPANDIIANLDE